MVEGEGEGSHNTLIFFKKGEKNFQLLTTFFNVACF